MRPSAKLREARARIARDFALGAFPIHLMNITPVLCRTRYRKVSRGHFYTGLFDWNGIGIYSLLSLEYEPLLSINRVT